MIISHTNVRDIASLLSCVIVHELCQQNIVFYFAINLLPFVLESFSHEV